MRITLLAALALTCAAPAAALAAPATIAVSDPAELPCYPHTFCTPDIVAASASFDPATSSIALSATFAAPLPRQQDPGAPGYELRFVLARSGTGGSCGNITSATLGGDLADGDLILRGFVAGTVANPQWADAQTELGGAPLADVRRAVASDGSTLTYAAQDPRLAGASFWCFEAVESPIWDSAVITDATPLATFPGSAPSPHISAVEAAPAPGSAHVSAVVDPAGSAGTVAVEFGSSSSYGTRTAAVPVAAGGGPVSIPLSGLAAGTAYHYRVVATSPAGTTESIDQTFTTSGRTRLVVAGRLRPGALARCSAAPAGAALAQIAWLRDGAPIAGAHASAYRVRAADVGHALRCRARAGTHTAISPGRRVSR